MALIDSKPYSIELDKATALLYEGEMCLPVNVDCVLRFCSDNGIGFILSRNVKVNSCRDARSNRVRLGHVGIPLFDELKSIIYKGHSSKGGEVIIAAHCRSHMNINEERIVELCSLTVKPIIMPEDELKKRFSMDYGSVNPMMIVLNSNGSILNLFDDGVTKPIAICPGTMMTNAGDHTWGIEFDPCTLIEKIRNKIVAPCAIPQDDLEYYDMPQLANPKSIGIITGNGADSGIALWNMINSCFVKIWGSHFLGDISLPEIRVISLPSMGMSMELDKRNSITSNAIMKAVRLLEGVDILALACHTNHYFTNKIRDSFERENRVFISMTETVIEYIKDSELTDFALIGINFVADLNGYSSYSELKELNIEHITPKDFELFSNLAYEVKKKKNLQASFQKFVHLINTRISSGNIIIALTELSILYQAFKKNKYSTRNIVDPLELYAKKISCASLGISNENEIKEAIQNEKKI